VFLRKTERGLSSSGGLNAFVA